MLCDWQHSAKIVEPSMPWQAMKALTNQHSRCFMAAAILKTCYRCKEIKPCVAFGYSSRFSDNLRKECKVCGRVEALAYRNANLEQQRQSKRDWDAKNKEYVLAYARKYVEENKDDVLRKAREYGRLAYWSDPEKAKAECREYRSKNAEKVRAQKKAATARNPEANRKRALQWAKDFPHLANAQVAARRAAKLRATPSWANPEAIKAVYLEARRRTEETGVVHHVDHFYPLISPVVCGLHCEENLRAIPAVDNYCKSNKMPDCEAA